jgi:hypothetical protein
LISSFATGFERPHFGDVSGQLLGTENHLTGVRRLTHFPVHLRLFFHLAVRSALTLRARSLAKIPASV